MRFKRLIVLNFTLDNKKKDFSSRVSSFYYRYLNLGLLTCVHKKRENAGDIVNYNLPKTSTATLRRLCI